MDVIQCVDIDNGSLVMDVIPCVDRHKTMEAWLWM